MRTLSVIILAACVTGLAADARSQPKVTKRAAPATKADVDRLEKQIEDQQKQIDKLVKLEQQYMQALEGALGVPVSSTDARPADVKPADPKPAPAEAVVEPKPEPRAEIKPQPAALRVKVEPKPKKPEGAGTIVGKVTGASDAVIYVDDIVASVRGSATMKQEGKQFVPRVLVVQKGTTVAFPNRDAIFHNVFSLTPDFSFDLGSYPQGESKSVTMTKAGVVSVYCNMHPQMVGHILVVPNGNYALVGKDGFFRLSNVPAGKHRVVAWAPNSKPVEATAEVGDTGVVTLELELKRSSAGPHTKKDGLPYGSYAD